MNSLFNLDNPVINFLSKVCDLVILNLTFLISCIPIITIGTAISSLYYVSLKIARQEEPYIWRSYWKAFRENFKQSTLVWLMFLPIIILIVVDFIFLRAQKGSIFSYMQIALWIVTTILLSIFIYIFPIMSHFVCTIKQAFKNAFLMSIGHLPYTVVLLILHGLIAFLCVWSLKSFVFIFFIADICGFSVVALVSSFIFDKVFKIYEPKQEESFIDAE